jgi:hypothetical protein
VSEGGSEGWVGGVDKSYLEVLGSEGRSEGDYSGAHLQSASLHLDLPNQLVRETSRISKHQVGIAPGVGF